MTLPLMSADALQRLADEPIRPNGTGGSDVKWADPDWSILDDSRGSLPAFPVDVFPAWSEWLERAAAGAGVTPGHVALPLLAIASGIIGTARRICPVRAWREPITLWTGVVGKSGTGKTPGLDVVTRGIANIESNRRKEVDALRRTHEAKAEAAKAARKKWKEEVQAAVEAGKPVPELPANAVEPGPFVEPRITVSDATVERLAVLMQARPRGLVMVADELAGLFLNMARYSGGSDREFWLQAWNGRPHVVERQGRAPVVLKHLLIGMTGGFQPDKLVRSFGRDEDGMYARLLMAWPEEPRYQPLSNDADDLEPEFLNALARLIDLPAEDDDGNLAPRAIWLSDDAVGEFEQFRQFLHAEKAGLDGRDREWAAKGPGQVLRLTGVLAYLDWSMSTVAEPEMIEAQYLNAAVRLWRDYFWPHSRAALRLIGLTDRHARARRVLLWIRANGKNQVSREDIRRDAMAQSVDADGAQALLDGLVKAGWLRELPAQKDGPGRPARRWEINPEAHSANCGNCGNGHAD